MEVEAIVKVKTGYYQMAKEDHILDALIAEGAMISDTQNRIVSLPIHAELVGTLPDRQLYFVQAGAEDQHHTHAVAFDDAQIVHDRDLSLTQEGKLVAYVAPIAEWPDVDQTAIRESLALARHYLATHPDATEAFQDFVAACRPIPAPVAPV